MIDTIQRYNGFYGVLRITDTDYGIRAKMLDGSTV
jgi:hypothetical protein